MLGKSPWLKISVTLLLLFFVAECKYCPDHSECLPETTCCQTDSGGYGCCPFPNAVCCSDKLHCCPHGRTCDVPHQRCNALEGGKLYSIKWDRHQQFLKFLSLISTPTVKQICPDHSQCNGTCCRANQGYGCCQFQHAVCCADQIHCCPQGTTCIINSLYCIDEKNTENGFILKKEKFQKIQISQLHQDSNQICPDHSRCNGTCCMLSPGKYGCCPLQSAVCCSDHLHCCPHDTVCDVRTATCKHKEISDGIIVEEGFQEIQMHRIPLDSNQICPDHSRCNGTCCMLSPGKYGCCPLQSAVCCSDHLHCCPHDTICDVRTASCRRKEEVSEGIMIVEEGFQEINYHTEGNNQICPDHTTCNGTCCKTSQGYGCCPLSHAVCCADHLHCCPEGSVCDVQTSSCRHKEESDFGLTIIEESLQKIEKSHSKNDSNGICPDQELCPGTCCKMGPVYYGCCRYQSGVCCSDEQHCCPHGTVCNLQTESCDKKDAVSNEVSFSEQSFQEMKIYQYPAVNDKNVCPDESYCPDQSTCCMLPNKTYGCCQFPNGICCSDQIHCCPSEYRCDIAHGCIHKNGRTVGLQETFNADEDGYPAAELLNPAIKDVPCPGFEVSCPSTMTCCLNGPGTYGCCPLPKAVCCADEQHCCPEYTTCNLTFGTCTGNSNLEIPWFSKISARALSNQNLNAVCPDNSTQCTDSQTCCINPDGTYRCCPFEEGVCCKDQLHCCGKDHRCTGKGKCKHKKHHFD